jgi:ERF superfamily
MEPENTSVVVHETAPPLATVPPEPITGPLQLLQLAISKGTDAAQLEKLMDLVERLERNKAAEAFGSALAEFQASCIGIVKRKKAEIRRKDGGEGYEYAYAGFEDLMEGIAPLMAKVGLAMSFNTELSQGAIKIVCRVRKGIHCEDTVVSLPIPSGGGANNVQQIGSGISYGKRYAASCALRLWFKDEDNDAAGCIERITEDEIRLLEDRLAAIACPVPRFLQWAGVESMDKILRAQVAKAHDMIDGLERRRKEKAK